MFRILEIWSQELLWTSFLFFVFPLIQGANMIDKQVTYAAGDEQTAEGPLTPMILHTQEESSSTPSTHICRPDGSSDSSDSRKIKQSKVRFGHNIAFAEDEDVERSPRCSEAAERSMAKRALYKRLLSNPKDELRHFRSGLLWLGLDQSSPTKVVLSWIVFFLFTLVVPVFNYNFVSCSECGEEHAHPFEKMVQVSETALAAVSFLCLSNIVRQYGLRRTLLLDKIIKESHDVRLGYEQELRVSSLSLSLSTSTQCNVSISNSRNIWLTCALIPQEIWGCCHRVLQSAFSLLAWILLPCFLIELIFRAWWYIYVSISIPFVPADSRLNVLLCSTGMLSWLYRTSVFLFMCVLFRLMCCLQILRLKGYKKLLEDTPDVSVILSEHLRIKSQLLTISHRFRIFMVSSLFTISFSQMSSLFVILGSAKSINFFRAGDLAVCMILLIFISFNWCHTCCCWTPTASQVFKVHYNYLLNFNCDRETLSCSLRFLDAK